MRKTVRVSPAVSVLFRVLSNKEILVEFARDGLAVPIKGLPTWIEAIIGSSPVLLVL